MVRLFRFFVLGFVLFSFGGCTKVGTKVGFVAATQTVNEAAGTATIEVALTEVSPLAVRIPYTLAGTASPAGGPTDDYLGSDGTLLIPIGSKTGVLTFPLVSHSSSLPDRTIIVNLGTPENAELGTVAIHTLTLQGPGGGGGGGGGPPVPPTLSWSADAFYEDPANNGSIYNRPISVQVTGGTWLNTAFIENTHYTLPGGPVPAGLTLSFNRVSNTEMQITLTGNAATHTGPSSSTMDIAFTAAAFTDGTSPIDGSETRTNFVLFTTDTALLYGVAGQTGNLGNRAAADAICSSNVPGGWTRANYKAVISYGTGDDIPDMTANPINVPVNQMLVSQTNDLIGGGFLDLVFGDFINNLATAGVMPAATNWWSGADSFGPPAAGVQCTNWTSSGGGDSGTVGTSDGVGVDWKANSTQTCNATNYLLCIGFD